MKITVKLNLANGGHWAGCVDTEFPWCAVTVPGGTEWFPGADINKYLVKESPLKVAAIVKRARDAEEIRLAKIAKKVSK